MVFWGVTQKTHLAQKKDLAEVPSEARKQGNELDLIHDQRDPPFFRPDAPFALSIAS